MIGNREDVVTLVDPLEIGSCVYLILHVTLRWIVQEKLASRRMSQREVQEVLTSLTSILACTLSQSVKPMRRRRRESSTYLSGFSPEILVIRTNDYNDHKPCRQSRIRLRHEIRVLTLKEIKNGTSR